LVAHNAQFDLRFLNKELQRIGRGNIPMSQSICTKDLASQHFGKGSLSLDKLCEHFGVDRQTRDQAHGALLDCHLLYQVYYKLRSIGGVEN
jgi:DNA polymerase-3 subunit epsilon